MPATKDRLTDCDDHKPDCTACGAPLLWALTEKKRRCMPLDPSPSADGNVILNTQGRAEMLGPSQREQWDGELYMPHHATCPSWGKPA